MAQEKDAFGFYFSAHPVDRYRHLAEARGAKSYGAICAEPVAEGGRANGVMAAMVEDVRWRETRRGARVRQYGRLCGRRRERGRPADRARPVYARSEEHTSELQSLMRISYAVLCLKQKK